MGLFGCIFGKNIPENIVKDFLDACQKGYNKKVSLLIPYLTEKEKLMCYNWGLENAIEYGHLNVIKLIPFNNPNGLEKMFFMACINKRIKIIMHFLSEIINQNNLELTKQGFAYLWKSNKIKKILDILNYIEKSIAIFYIVESRHNYVYDICDLLLDIIQEDDTKTKEDISIAKKIIEKKKIESVELAINVYYVFD